MVVAGCSGGDAEDSPPPEEPDTLVAMVLDDLAHAESIDSENGTNIGRRRLPFGCGDAPYQFMRLADRLIFCGGEGTYSIDPELKGPVERLGRSAYFLPAGDDTVWLVDHPQGIWSDSTPHVPMRLVRGDGEMLESGRAECVPFQASEAGPVCLRGANENELEYELFDLSTGKVAARVPGLGNPITSGDLVLTCRERCTLLHATNAKSGQKRQIELEQPVLFWDPQFSPDGNTLATIAHTESPNPRRRFPKQKRPVALALVDIDSGDVKIVDKSTPGGVYGRLAWSADGKRIYFGISDKGEVGAYDLESDRISRVPFDFGDTIFQLAAF